MRVPALLLVLGIALFGGCLFLLQAHHWTPLMAPISLQPGQAVSHSFTVDLDAEYSVGIAVDRVLPSDQLRTKLEALELKCRVEELDGKLIGEFDRKGWGSNSDDVERSFGVFDGKKHHSYRITLKSESDGRPLAGGNPRLLVREASGQQTAYVTWAQLLALPALGLIGSGGIWLSAFAVSRLRKS